MRGAAARRQQRREGESEPASAAGALLTLLARALRLERAAILVEESPGQALVPLAIHGRTQVQTVAPGDAPEDEPWSLTRPSPSGGRTAGDLLLARPGGARLSPADAALAGALADLAAHVVDQARTRAELDRSRELLARADRLSALGTLAAGMAHEIRNPLVSVRTFIQLLPERLADEEFRTNFRDLALAEIERICALINDLLAFSRPTPAQREPTDVGELAGQIARLLDAEARKHDVVVRCTTEPGLPLIVVDDAQVKQVLMNVVLNAIQACQPHGAVDVGTRLEESDAGTWCIVDVADSGPGIAPEHMHQIFDPFFTTKDAGSGLGLFIAHRIVSEHGGHITPAPRAGGGTVFSIHFPIEARLEDVDAGAI